MRLVITKSDEESARLAAECIAEVVNEKRDSLLGFATGSTPEPVYAQLVAMCARGEVDFSGVRTVNLDEYVGLNAEDPHSYMYYMRKNLFDKAGIDLSRVTIPRGDADPEEEVRRLNAFSDKNNIDIQLLGVGVNGHIGFNEPCDCFYNKYHIVTLTEKTKKSNSRMFSRMEDVPERAITMGVGDIMRAKRIVFLANGIEKLDAMKAILEPRDVTPRIQGTILKFHQDCKIIIDKVLAELINPAPEVEVSYT